MKIECIREKLHQAISLAEKSTGKNMTLPVLGCILLDAKDNELVIKATNLDIGIEVRVPVKIDRPGRIAVPGSVLASCLAGVKGDTKVILEENDKNLHVTTSRNSTVIKAVSADDFPTIPRVQEGASFVLAGKLFVQGLKSVWYSSSISSIKPELSSVYIYPDNEYVVFAATDSFRLAEKRIKTDIPADFGQILIPFKNVPDIIRVLEIFQDDVTINLNKNQISFETHGVFLVSRVIDGVFPDYKQIIPKESKTEIITLKQDFIDTLKLSNIFSDKFNQIHFKVDVNKSLFEITTKNNDIGESVNKIDAKLTGEDIEINFNGKYINDCFQSIATDSISLNLNGLNRALVIRPVGDMSFMYLVMPMNR